eukprot:CAMPEP_0114594886 /NCGR_PEP_ID=MMETSP0125-20121206/16597_1 /TAXON_ID=485358 ORGANISM="Aristerostoma sp., Strain ATCC 50986" /NCGR_SAMPLE_ID=MMETSP0125 /ASSEMBLY_ACC=CAM_ASM_000245 /LENGTH=50 /DNA_ID=CAMNT_0001795747 /DNA_START=65 /DNA_END=217 /DNA_ORIENTATION=+
MRQSDKTKNPIDDFYRNKSFRAQLKEMLRWSFLEADKTSNGKLDLGEFEA